ncbi:MAG: DotU family type IV/VI secretion system protein [Planctomycetota bacterium]|nr:DotU family type IV/VI secretion system protein [Planctomycetaceae bacterium]MDQ3330265.1 DotU family type IV/VI secretion system protein [Planctomycetota bacterium]
MTPKFAALVDPVFHHVLDLAQRLSEARPVDLHRERNTIRALLERAETAAADRDHPVNLEHFRLAKRGLVFWADEVLNRASPAWSEMILEREYYGTRERGYQFYVDAEKARAAHPDLAELWYLALAMGFKGDIREAYARHLKRPLPGGTSDETVARDTLANDLKRDVRVPAPAPPTGEPLGGDVRPLRGTTMARGAWQLAALLIAIAVVLGGIVAVRSSSNSGSVTTGR